MLNTVRIPISFLTWPTYFMDLLKSCANIKPIPVSSTHFCTSAGSAIMLTPSASNTSPAPDFEEMERLPCFVTGSPAAATTNADVVEILNV